MVAILKKEFKSYLLSPIGYIFIGIFLLMLSVFFYLEVCTYKSVNFEYLFYSGATVLTFIVPVLTMRMFAEERKNGTEQLILTSPISITGVVLGKFIAAALIIVVTEVFSLMYFAILSYFSTPSISVAIITLIGFLLLSLAYISFGMFASSITENQIVACIITIGCFIAMWFLPGINQVFSIFSLINMFDKFPSGVISITEVITFVTFTILFVLLTIIVLQRRKSVK